MPNTAIDPVVARFVEALFDVEERREIGPLLDVFSTTCEVSNPALPGLHGHEGVERFWRDYLSTFREVRTMFTRITEATDLHFLEWVSQGTLASGKSFVYEGITLLQLDGEHIRNMKAYFDSAVFVKDGPKHAGDSALNHASGLVMEHGENDHPSTPGEGVLTSRGNDRDSATG